MSHAYNSHTCHVGSAARRGGDTHNDTIGNTSAKSAMLPITFQYLLTNCGGLRHVAAARIPVPIATSDTLGSTSRRGDGVSAALATSCPRCTAAAVTRANMPVARDTCRDRHICRW